MQFPKNKREINPELLKKLKLDRCWVCNSRPVDPSHIKSRGSGGPDTEWNVVPKCRMHHTEWGWSWSKFLKKYPAFALRLRLLGWSWDSGRLDHPKLHSEL